MSFGQGNITFSTPPAGPGGGGVVAGARDGLSLDGANFAVLGEDAGAPGDPAQLTSNRFIPMMGFALELQTQASGLDCSVFNDGDSKLLFAMSQGNFFITYQPENYNVDYTPNGVGERFASSYALYNGVNPDGRPNVTGTFWGYNNSKLDGRVNPLEASFRFTTETYFQIGVNPNFEFHLPEITTTSGNIFRIDSTYVNRDLGTAFQQKVLSDWAIFSTDFGVALGNAWLHGRYDTATVSFEIGQNTSGSVSQLRFLNFADATTVTMELAVNQFFINTGTGISAQINASEIFLIPSAGSFVSLGRQTVVTDAGFALPLFTSTVLECQSTTKGFLPPVMTSVQRLAIAAPAEGLHVYDSTTHTGFYFNGTTWVSY